jgi:3-oxoadipate enol-lactonase
MFVRAGELIVHVQEDGPEGAPPLLMLHSLGTSLHVWDRPAAMLVRRRRLIRPDLRGHGLTSVPPGPYTIDGLAHDALALLDERGIDRVAVCGLSIGGTIAQALTALAPARVSALILCDTAMHFPPPALWHERARIARTQGMEPLVAPVLARWVTPAFLDDPEAEGLRAMLRRTAPEGYAAAAEALATADLRASTARLRLPTLVLVGEQDEATPPSAASAIAAAIPGARLVTIPRAAHLPTVERPAEVADAISAFLES